MFGILKSEAKFPQDRGRIVIVLHSQYEFLKSELKIVFKGQPEVMVIIDRRSGERRQNPEFFPPERRSCDRRTSKSKIGSAIISI